MKYTHWALKFTNYDGDKVHLKRKLYDTRAEAYEARAAWINNYSVHMVKIKVIKVNAGPFECVDDAERV
tara:strand:+ start:254 stop:460 length:207 start_codon:yes stop_codon:yes gene_type:complete